MRKKDFNKTNQKHVLLYYIKSSINAMLKTFEIHYLLSNCNYLIEIDVFKTLFSLEKIFSFFKPCYRLAKIELFTEIVTN